MAFIINSNIAADKASLFLSRNNNSLRRSMTRMASGKRVIDPSDDAGGLAVSMKIKSASKRLRGSEQNIQNAISFLQVQDGVLAGISELVDRMSELRALSNDVLKNQEDLESYNKEFKDLQLQMFDMAQEKFNEVSLFARYTEEKGLTESLYGGTSSQDNTVNLYVSEDGESGPVISINKSSLLSALTISRSLPSLDASEYGNADQNTIVRFASAAGGQLLNLTDLSVAVFKQVIENISSLRSENGATMSRLLYSSDNAARKRTNLISANGKIMDVDVASESTNLAKQNVLVQASASMLAQANDLTSLALALLK
jgi:flagellin